MKISLPISMLASFAALASAGTAATAAGSYRVIYRFAGGADGATPTARVVTDERGNLYGTTYNGGISGTPCSGNGCGTIFELKRPAQRGGTWSETILYRFTGGSDGYYPASALARDAAGNLYGTTSGSFTDCEDKLHCGTVYELSPPQRGQSAWTLQTLHAFTGGPDGGCPLGTLVRESNGELFGAACYGGPFGYGAIYALQPPAIAETGWTERIVYGFPQDAGGHEPIGTVAFDAAGNAFGTTLAGGLKEQGVAYELTPAGNGRPWHETVRVLFNGTNGRWPLGPPVIAPNGTVYATTLTGGCDGTVFALTPPAFARTLVYAFCNARNGLSPTPQLALDPSGNLYGTTANGGAGSAGVVFALTSRKGQGWNERVLHAFAGGHDGATPEAGVTSSGEAFYGTTSAGGAGTCAPHGPLAECGTVYEIVP